MKMTLHTFDEIKGKAWNKVQRQLRWLNDALTQAVTAEDPEWREMQRQRYDNLLPAVHVNGLAGSLLAENLQAQLDATAAKLGKRIVAIGDASGVTAVDAEWAAQRDLDQTQDAAAGRWGY